MGGCDHILKKLSYSQIGREKCLCGEDSLSKIKYSKLL